MSGRKIRVSVSVHPFQVNLNRYTFQSYANGKSALRVAANEALQQPAQRKSTFRSPHCSCQVCLQAHTGPEERHTLPARISGGTLRIGSCSPSTWTRLVSSRSEVSVESFPFWQVWVAAQGFRLSCNRRDSTGVVMSSVKTIVIMLMSQQRPRNLSLGPCAGTVRTSTHGCPLRILSLLQMAGLTQIHVLISFGSYKPQLTGRTSSGSWAIRPRRRSVRLPM